ncbi:MAG: hypothetical protein Greene041679_19 [Parcubacteria group bacterium Greene0416_79]|nr:MAG: hypothetical protein Greene041679_19 [Parcubacteria group bacterium Greene0416_79]
MGILDKIFGSNEENEYKAVVAQISNPLMDKIDTLEDREVRDFFKTILDAAERSLRGILFMAPEEFHFKKMPTKEEVDFWLRKVSLALVAYSFHFFSVEEQPSVGQFSYKMYWQRMFDSYNKVFGENITVGEINHYAEGLKEDSEKGYSKSGDLEKMMEATTKDHATIAIELLKKIWHENIDSEVLNSLKAYKPHKPGYGVERLNPIAKKTLFLGARIWQAHQQIVQPFLPKLLTDY